MDTADFVTKLHACRPEDGRTVTKGRHQLDNRWVVPYNPYLAQKYNAHINVDVCATIKSVKDIYKHGFKGHDRAPVQITAGVSLLLSVAAWLYVTVSKCLFARHSASVLGSHKVPHFPICRFTISNLPLAHIIFAWNVILIAHVMQVVAEHGEPQDEIKQYLDARYVGSIEACWRIFRFVMHKEWPNVVRLQVHLPNQQVC